MDLEKEFRDELRHRLGKIEDKQETLLVTVTTLKVKFGVISMIFGAIGSAAMTVVLKLFGV